MHSTAFFAVGQSERKPTGNIEEVILLYAALALFVAPIRADKLGRRGRTIISGGMRGEICVVYSNGVEKQDFPCRAGASLHSPL